jgi:hypothetical protein
MAEDLLDLMDVVAVERQQDRRLRMWRVWVEVAVRQTGAALAVLELVASASVSITT